MSLTPELAEAVFGAETIERLEGFELTAVDLCCGGGGWACAARGLPIRFVAVADLDRDSLDTWRENHLAANAGCEILQVNLATTEGLADVDAAISSATGGAGVDLVLGAIPCEQLSCARGAKKASAAEMQQLYALIDSLLQWTLAQRPRAWCLEDVIQIEKHLPTPLELGADVPMRRLDAAEFGPQSRLRTFLGAFPEPQRPAHVRTLEECLLPGPWLTIRDAERYERTTKGRVGKDKVRVINGEKSKAPTVITARSNGDRQRRSWLVEHRKGDEPKSPTTISRDCSRRAFMIQEGKSPTLTGRLDSRANNFQVDEGGYLRCLDWQEAALLQGFPADYRFVASWTKAQKLIGQAISIDVGRAILSGIVAEAAKERLA